MLSSKFESDEINEIANLAFVSGSKNRAIGNKTPDVYFPGILAERGPEALDAQKIPRSPELWNVENYRQFLEVRRKGLAEAVNAFLDEVAMEGSSAAVDAAGLILAGENEQVEFKETARWSIYLKQVDKGLEAVIAKTVAGFLNAAGGTLLVGVSDKGVPVGLTPDLTTLGKRQDFDGYEQFLRQLLIDRLGKNACAEVNISFPQVDSVHVCMVQVPSSPSAVYFNDGNGSQAF